MDTLETLKEVATKDEEKNNLVYVKGIFRSKLLTCSSDNNIVLLVTGDSAVDVGTKELDVDNSVAITLFDD